MTIVTIEKCPDYQGENLQRALEQALAPLGGMKHFVRPGQTVLLKPNLLRKATPEEAVATHPDLVRAVVEMVKQAGGKPLIGDSPGGAITAAPKALLKLYRGCGLDRVARETGAELVLDPAWRVVSLPRGRRVKRIEIIDCALQADVIINLPKLKTHSFTLLTGAVKNLFGLVPGLTKPAYHAKFPEVGDFCSMLIDLLEFANPALTIVDAVWAMEGSGPGAGDLRKMGLIVAGDSPPAVDAILSRIVGVAPFAVPTLVECRKRGLLAPDLSGIEVRGESVEAVKLEDFRVPPVRSRAFPAWTTPFLPIARRFFATRPRIERAKCVGCGDCVRVCPVKTIVMKNGKAEIKLSRCIHCFCCHEACAHRAIALIRPLAQRLMV